MSARKQNAIVSRRYQAAPDYCARALQLLLGKPVKKATRPGGPDDVRKVQGAHTAKEQYTG